MAETIYVNVEMEPHREDLSGEILNRPAPNSGAFLIPRRVERRVWDRMKAAGAWYWSEEDLEDFDMFLASPGWRYSFGALKILLEEGYELDIDGESAGSVEELERMFSAPERGRYHDRKKREHQERLEREAEEKRLKEEEKARKGEEYEAWRAERKSGLEETYTGPGSNFDWGERIAFFDKETPKAWYTTGDSWYEAEVAGEKVYRREYGNAVLFYGSRRILDEWIERDFAEREREYGKVKAAQHALRLAGEYPDGGVVGANDAIRIIELRGEEAMVAQATEEPWYLREGTNLPEREAEMLISRYGIESITLKAHPYPGYEVLSRITHPEALDSSGKPQNTQRLWMRPEDGRIIGETYYGLFFDLSSGQVDSLPVKTR